MQLDTLFLDRDGVLNRKIDNSYVLKAQDVELLPGMNDFLIFASRFFKRIVVVTNQRCVGRELLTMQELRLINDLINAKLGSFILEFFVCPHLSEQQCDCRKPKQGLFINAAAKYEIDFKRSWMIGDSETDLIPASQLGIKAVYISDRQSPLADITVRSTRELQEVFLEIISGTVPVDVVAR